MTRLRPGFALAAAAGLAACSLWSMSPGTHEDGEVVEVRGADLPEAERNAVSSLMDLYLSSGTLASSRDAVSQKLLGRAGAFVKKRKVVEKGRDGAVLARVLVSHAALAAEVERLGLDAPSGPGSRVLLDLKEDAGSACALCPAGRMGLGHGAVELPGVPGAAVAPETSAKPGAPAVRACREAGCASESLRRALIRRGFSVWDASDRLSPEPLTGDPVAAARKLGAGILVQGSARAGRVEDPRLSGYVAARARVELVASRVEPGEPAAVSLGREATAVDLNEDDAAAKALENAGDALGDELAGRLGSAWKVDATLTLSIAGFRELAEVRRVIADLRALDGVVSVALASFAPPEARLRVRTVKAADALTAQVLGLRAYGFNALAVGQDMVELETLKGADEDRF